MGRDNFRQGLIQQFGDLVSIALPCSPTCQLRLRLLIYGLKITASSPWGYMFLHYIHQEGILALPEKALGFTLPILGYVMCQPLN